MLRRHALGVLFAGAVGSLDSEVFAAKATTTGTSDGKPIDDSTVLDIDRGPDGTTLTLRAAHAPYPCKGGAYTDPTVMVFVPSTFRLPESKRVDAVVHFHGHHAKAKSAMASHKLREQLVGSRQNAVLVVPQGPVNAADGDFGKLMRKGGLRRLLSEVLKLASSQKVSRVLGDASLASATAVGRVIASAHSGGYRAAAAIAARGGVEAREIYLFDALYGELDSFEAFVLKKAGGKRKLINYAVGGAPLSNGAKLAKRLRARGVDVIIEKHDRRVSRDELVKGRAIFLLGHATHATAPYEEKALRDCLLASCFVGHGTKAWHQDKKKTRSTG